MAESESWFQFITELGFFSKLKHKIVLLEPTLAISTIYIVDLIMFMVNPAIEAISYLIYDILFKIP